MCVAPNNARGHYVWWRADITRNEGPSSDRAKFYRTHNCLCNKTQLIKNEIFIKRFSAIWTMDISPFTSNAQRFATSILCNSLKMCSLHKSVNVKSLYLAKISRTLGHYWAIALRNFVITDNLVTSNESYFFTWESILLFGLYGVAD